MVDYTADYLLDKQIRIFQPIDGYRASTDAVFLSSLISRVKANEQILDVGSGTGAVSLCLAHRFPQNKIIGLEIQPELTALSNMSARANAFENLCYFNCDINKPLSNQIAKGSFEHVVSNPPYSDHDMPSPKIGKATAHNFNQSDLSKWIDFMLTMLKPNGYFYMVNRAEALDEILYSLHKKAGAIDIVPLYSKACHPAKRVLISARKNSKTPLKIEPELVIHKVNGDYTDEAHRILRLGQNIAQAFSKSEK